MKYAGDMLGRVWSERRGKHTCKVWEVGWLKVGRGVGGRVRGRRGLSGRVGGRRVGRVGV